MGVLLQDFHDQIWLFHEGAASKRGKEYQHICGSTILRLAWRQNILYHPGFKDFQPYQTYTMQQFLQHFLRPKFGMCPDLLRILLWECSTLLFSAIGFRGKLFRDMPPPRPAFGLQLAIFMQKSGWVAAIACDTTENTVRQGSCDGCLAIGGPGGVYFGRVTKTLLGHLSFCRHHGRKNPQQQSCHTLRRPATLHEVTF